ncbi:hypothetical protein H8K90_04500 [Winogradskyella echinorum]|uniref:Uncharacterized protein n=1 Tax=Winogradskyella echinorum TaxID=538189 RepID=A0ABR6XYR5_9FLAO|nr:hypothetical protein [Winogradskyella echinorum]MBC3845627.1 hypothetical protein [Winogradskyella echinorum]MBC5749975.1 hypothetical protein [Winogradskyella echinorum]
METSLNIALIELKLSQTKFRPSLSEVLNELKKKEARCYQTKVISISETIINKSSKKIKKLKTNSSTGLLGRLLTA